MIDLCLWCALAAYLAVLVPPGAAPVHLDLDHIES